MKCLWQPLISYLSSLFLSPITLAGIPATIVYGATSCVTTAPAATTAPSPMCTLWRIMVCEPIQALSSITTGLCCCVSQRNHGSLWSCCSVQILTLLANTTLSPMVIPFRPSRIALSPIIEPFPIDIFDGSRTSAP